jgi:hypothetical protein
VINTDLLIGFPFSGGQPFGPPVEALIEIWIELQVRLVAPKVVTLCALENFFKSCCASIKSGSV